MSSESCSLPTFEGMELDAIEPSTELHFPELLELLLSWPLTLRSDEERWIDLFDPSDVLFLSFRPMSSFS